MILWIIGYVVIGFITSIILSVYFFKHNGYIGADHYTTSIVLGFIWPITLFGLIFCILVAGWLRVNKFIIKHIKVK